MGPALEQCGVLALILHQGLLLLQLLCGTQCLEVRHSQQRGRYRHVHCHVYCCCTTQLMCWYTWALRPQALQLVQ